ncbi:MAG: CvpA family protein [Defluviitaleaceae bacterium]|nr:CvpA family protein [Defluviitaleaceae bacterium]
MPTIVSGIDIIVVAVLCVFIYSGYRKGLLRMIFGLFSVFFAIALANVFYGVVSSALRQTPMFPWLQEQVTNALGLSELISANINDVIAQADIIEGLQLPRFVIALLHANNNPEVFNMLGITFIEEYIASFVALIIINIISAVIVFLLVLTVLKIVSKSLRMFNHIPIIGGLNRLGGAACGAAFAMLAIWSVLAVVWFMETGEAHAVIYETMLTRFFYENNLILDFLMDIL